MTGISSELYINLYRGMWLVRSFEFALEKEFEKGHVPGMLHTGVGQEAVQAAIAGVLTGEDVFFPDHRCHGLQVLAGMPGEKLMAEIFGRATGVCSGMGGSVHCAHRDSGNLGNNGVQGSALETVLGAGLGLKMQREASLAAVIFGDGTSFRGDFHESLNLASTWKLPVLYCCVNNGYAISTPIGSVHGNDKIHEFARAYHRPVVEVDGNDLLAAYQATQEAADYIRSAKGPYFIEYRTWRWQGLFSGEFRGDDEVHYWKEEHDPIRMTRADLLQKGILDEAGLVSLEKAVDTEVLSWIQFALDSPPPDPDAATRYVYANNISPG